MIIIIFGLEINDLGLFFWVLCVIEHEQLS